ncbi:MAG: hypothetical protein ACI865_000543 [Flavobacteriaceae bacterium]|jgi:UDP:flavonoid glycosyltransferase YjiC (YdhE family)
MQIETVVNKRILLSPLNWGMGHVSRCIGLIDALQSNGNTIVVACSEDQRSIFGQYFEDLTFTEHAGYPFNFKGKGNFGLDLLNKSSSLFKRLKQERKEVEAFVVEYKIDLVLSDHRYGFRSTEVPSIFVTHQVNLPVRLHERMVSVIHGSYLSKYDYIWVMDNANSDLAGKLSTSRRRNVSYIGPFSRFSRYLERPEKKFKHVLIASGPNIYAQQLVDEVLANDQFGKGLVVIHNGELSIPDDIKALSGNWKEQDQVIMQARHLISRSGYSTIMDSTVLDTEATLIPTKGQREQEYLAELFFKK